MASLLEAAAGRPASNKGTRQRIWSRLTGRAWLSPRYDPVFTDGLSATWLRTNLEAFRRFRGVRPHDLTHVGLFAFSRGGSHLLESQFHLTRCCFCFGESSFDFRADINWRTFLCHGMFRTDSIQNKSAGELTHLFYNCNNAPLHLEKPQWQLHGATDYRRKWILVLRNPLRILLSRQETGKGKWRISPDSAGAFLEGFERVRAIFRKLLEKAPGDASVVSIERFAAAPEPALREIAASAGIDPAAVAGRLGPEQFFRRLGRTGEVPILRDGQLASPTRPIAVSGWGGGFNPLAPLDAERLYEHELATALTAEILDVARRRLGARALELYMSDRDHRFLAMSANDLLQ